MKMRNKMSEILWSYEEEGGGAPQRNTMKGKLQRMLGWCDL